MATERAIEAEFVDDWDDVTDDVNVGALARGGGGGSAGERLLAAGNTVQGLTTKYAQAVKVQFPRELERVRHNLLAEARVAGESFYYSWSVGKKEDRARKETVSGPSVKLAMAAARCWGNCAVEPQEIQELGNSWVMPVWFVDLETGFTLGRSFRMSKQWTIHGNVDAARKEDMRFQIGQSKATRNVILNALPSWLMEAAVKEAKRGVRAKVERYIEEKGHAAAVEYILKRLAAVGVTEEAVLDKLGLAKAEAMAIDQIVQLRGDLIAIEDGVEFASEIFPLLAAQAEEAAPAGNGAGKPRRAAAPKSTATTELERDLEELVNRERPAAGEQAAQGAAQAAGGKTGGPAAENATAGDDAVQAAKRQQLAELVASIERLEELAQLARDVEAGTTSPDEWFALEPLFAAREAALVAAQRAGTGSDKPAGGGEAFQLGGEKPAKARVPRGKKSS